MRHSGVPMGRKTSWMPMSPAVNCWATIKTSLWDENHRQIVCNNEEQTLGLEKRSSLPARCLLVNNLSFFQFPRWRHVLLCWSSICQISNFTVRGSVAVIGISTIDRQDDAPLDFVCPGQELATLAQCSFSRFVRYGVPDLRNCYSLSYSSPLSPRCSARYWSRYS